MTERIEPTHHKSPTILIADPSENFSRLFASLLMAAGMRDVHFSYTGRQTVGTAAKLKPDLILLDRSIQAMDSFATLSNLKYLLPDTRVILLVSFVDSSSLTRARELGIDGFYSKSVDPKELVQAVCNLLRDTNINNDAKEQTYTATTPFLDLNSRTKRLNPKEDPATK